MCDQIRRKDCTMIERDPLDAMREADEANGEGPDDRSGAARRTEERLVSHGPENDTEDRYGEDESPA